MPKRPSPYPTEAELEILNVLWRRGDQTVREVHEALQADRRTSLTTTLKLLQIMTEKGLVHASDTRPHRYTAAASEEKMQAGLLDDLVRRAFDGSASKLLVRAVEHGKLTPRELDEMQQLINMRRKEARR
jgi:BlaI family transcriptional regulator, penicillinase repressor